MDITDLKRRMAVKASSRRTPTKSSLEQEKPLKTQAKGQHGESSASVSPAFALPPPPDPAVSLERFLGKDLAPLPDDFENVLSWLKAANPDSIQTDLASGQRITNSRQFLASHITALEGLRQRPSSMLFAAYYRRAKSIAMRSS